MNAVDRALLEFVWTWLPVFISGWVLTFYGLSHLLRYLARHRPWAGKAPRSAAQNLLAQRLAAAAKLCGPIGGAGALVLVFVGAAIKALRH